MIRSIFLSISLLVVSGYGQDPLYPVVILGGGISALTSALYLGRAELSPVVIEGQTPGGLLTQSHSVQNWPGEMEIEGHLLTEKMRLQAEANGAQLVSAEVVSVDFSKRPFLITIRSTEGSQKQSRIRADACIIAMGTEPNFLGIPGETGPNGYWGRGVTNCAICDGSLYRDRVVGVVGGGDAAVLEALYLSNIAKEVSVFVRKDALKASEKKRVEALLEKSNVHILYNTQVAEIQGNEEGVSSVVIQTKGKGARNYPLDGLFLAIGSKPNSRIFKNKLAMDSRGYVLVDNGQKTSVEGVYAVGDIVDPVYKQAICAAGDGAKAALQAQQYISDRMSGLVAAKKATLVEKKEKRLEEVVVEINSLEQFYRELEQSEIPVVVDFYATWCGPCKKITPTLDASAAKLSGKVKFLKVNVDKLPSISDTYNIRSMPTTLFLNASGEILDRKVGLGPITRFLESLETESVAY